MPSFSDSIFLFILALLLFGPKKLPVLARELGKWVGEFRRASNEFKMQMEDELRQVEQADRLKKIEAMEAAAPVAPALPSETATITHETGDSAAVAEAIHAVDSHVPAEAVETAVGMSSEEPAAGPSAQEPTIKPIAIAGSGEVTIMPPATGLPTPRNSSLSGLLRSIPAVPATESNATHSAEEAVETSVHGD
jgi:sec-independent protein translocase protein TatB